MEFATNVDTNQRFVTLHTLARELNKPERQIRYRFHSLRKAGKLQENADYVKDGFVDEQHFEYKISPLRFMQESQIALDHESVSKVDEVVSNLDTGQRDVGNDEQRQDEANGSKDVYIGSSVDNKNREPVTKIDNTPRESVTKDTNIGNNQVLEDYVETLKEQMRVKDSQIEGYRNQLSDQSDLNKRSIGELLKAHEQIRLLATRPPDQKNVIDVKDNHGDSPEKEQETVEASTPYTIRNNFRGDGPQQDSVDGIRYNRGNSGEI